MLKALLEKRAGLLEEMQSLADVAETEDRDLSAEEQEQWESLQAELDTTEKRISRAETLARHNEDAGQTTGSVASQAGAGEAMRS